MRLTPKFEIGMSLIELLIGVLLGTIVAAGAMSVYITSIQGQTDNVQLTRLNQDMRAMMDIMVRDIRRAGFVTDNPEPDAEGGFLSSLENNPFFAANADILISADGRCIVYSYNKNYDAEKNATPPISPTVDNDERFGFRLNASNNLQMRTSGTTNTDCNNGTWQSITEPEVEITALKFTLTSSTLNVSSMASDEDDDGCFDGDDKNPTIKESPCATGNYGNDLCDAGEGCNTCIRDGISDDPACLTIRTVTIDLSGRLRDDHNVTQTINSRVRVRNDKYFPPVP